MGPGALDTYSKRKGNPRIQFQQNIAVYAQPLWVDSQQEEQGQHAGSAKGSSTGCTSPTVCLGILA